MELIGVNSFELSLHKKSFKNLNRNERAFCTMENKPNPPLSLPHYNILNGILDDPPPINFENCKFSLSCQYFTGSIDCKR